ncbi:2-oxoacid:acceptor oxidoreductase family protein [Paenalcaligenes niemegkensis]|nr:DUF6537 domain-containing protein [Paenalcaligenes niemegkensis]MCQ9615428.1 2-oxoacid:acceptor oxidoreductase family protein [Paenalcaligenes niemegkensis]
MRLGADARPLGAVRIDTHRASVAILCDMVAASSRAVIRPLMHGHTITVLNEYIAPTAEFIRNPDISLSPSPIQAQLLEHLGANNVHTLDAHKLALRLFGDSIMSNMMMLGMAWQLGGIPVQAEAIEQAITLNGVAVATNTEAFRFGRVLAVHNDLIKKLCADEKPIRLHRAESLESLIAQNAKRLQNYQNTSYATRYTKLVEQLHHKEKQLYPDRKPILSEQAAKSLYKLMAYKDEYEVARLYADSSFRTALHKQFEGDFELKFHLAPPLFSKKDPRTGIPRKQSFGARTEKLFVMLAKAKVLRGTPLDPFSYMPERRTERRLRDDFESLLLQMTRSLTKQNYSTARRIAELPLQIRGFGHVKLAAIANYEQALEELLPQFFETQGLIQKRQVITV